MDGRIIGPYNVLLQVSALAAAGGLIENRSQWRWGFGTVLLVAPVLRWITPREYDRLLEQAKQRPSWWNRRLARGPSRPATQASRRAGY
ncbi:hypothetical protein [Nocardioides sp. Kera G14]|uniref:hypothetical protein n=1 Tax=Nocardioides sp. Kera G14 TaxID=2884264 RepID=UPI001D10CDBC|nr:hypothetical protein [Nocardioides sp. Kera G14]UDY24636.1 hypothetical protein LH076_04840 [Nocardioides sp. Kera G14]